MLLTDLTHAKRIKFSEYPYGFKWIPGSRLVYCYVNERSQCPECSVHISPDADPSLEAAREAARGYVRAREQLRQAVIDAKQIAEDSKLGLR